MYALRYGNRWEFCGQGTDVVTATKLRLEQRLEDAANRPSAGSGGGSYHQPIRPDDPEEALETYLAKIGPAWIRPRVKRP